MRLPLVYKNKPVLGLDIGSRSAKIVQLSGTREVIGYGYATYPADTIVEGIISDPKPIAEAIKAIIKSPKSGSITARRAIISVPVAQVFSRTLQLPIMNAADLRQALTFEAEQYVPVPISDLYIDYDIIDQDEKGDHIDVLMVAAPRAIVDSYIKLFDYVDMEVDWVETSLSAITRSMIEALKPEQAAMVVDFGSKSTDLTIYDEAIRLTGTFEVGGDNFTQALSDSLKITLEQANDIKYKFGLSGSDLQVKMIEALSPQLKIMVTEFKKAIKYYEDRSESKKTVDAVILSGGSSNLPGLVDYLYKELGIAIIVGDPWIALRMNKLTPVSKNEAPMYSTAIGLALKDSHD